MKNIIAKASAVIDAPASKVWEALTSPQSINQYLEGLKVITDWKAGSPITFTGNVNGKPYKGKGIVLHHEPPKLLQYTSLNLNSATEDKPENYAPVCFELYEENNATALIIKQENLRNEAARERAKQNWSDIITNLKSFLEGGHAIPIT